jgi:hypothetical protein
MIGVYVVVWEPMVGVGEYTSSISLTYDKDYVVRKRIDVRNHQQQHVNTLTSQPYVTSSYLYPCSGSIS